MSRALALLAILVAGCAGPFTRVAAPPTATPQLGTLASGSACGVLVLGLIPVRMTSRTERAYAEAPRGASASGLADPAISTHWYSVGVGTVHCVDVDGTAVR